MPRQLFMRFLVLLLLPVTAWGQSREEKVRADRARVEAEGFWIYNDLPRAMDEARRTGKPLLVNLRCIPCEECVKLDDELVDQDPMVRPLLEQFVCVRVVGTNGLDLSLFQFDTDQSFAAFMLHPDGTILGRFGTRSHRTEWLTDVSLPGMAKALQGALELHAGFPAERAALDGKRGPKPLFPVPEAFPSLKEKYTSTLNYEGNVVQSCIHCHQIGDAQREYYRHARKPIPLELLYPYPHPKAVGLVLDPEERASVKAIAEGSAAQAAGFQPGDQILTLEEQPLLSMADVQWVLNGVPASGGEVRADVQRRGQSHKLVLRLAEGWREASDLSWRASTWTLRRMATGGMVLEPLAEAERSAAGLEREGMALRAKHVGQYGPHAAAKNAGFRAGDVLIEVAGRRDFKTESDLLRYALRERRPGEILPVTVVRGQERMQLKLPMQD